MHEKRVVVSEHRTRMRARGSRRRWRGLLERARAGDNVALRETSDANLPSLTGKVVVERGGRNEKQKWAVLYDPEG